MIEPLLVAVLVVLGALSLAWRAVRALERGGQAPELASVRERLAALEEMNTASAAQLAQLEEQQRFTEQLLAPPATPGS
jgi:threonine/homoserine/homoserine lactone efflux protein